MPSVIIFDTNNGRVLGFIKSTGNPEYATRPDAIVYDDRTDPSEEAIKQLVDSVGINYLKVANQALSEMTSQEKIDRDNSDAQQRLAEIKSGAVASIDGLDGYELRAIAKMMIDEINSLRQWIVEFKAAIAASSSMSDMKSRVALLPDMPDRTLTQAKTVYKGLINGSSIDE